MNDIRFTQKINLNKGRNIKPSAKRTLKIWSYYLIMLTVFWPLLDEETWRGLTGIGAAACAIMSLYLNYSDG